MAKPLSRVHFKERWPEAARFGKDVLLIYDKKLEALAPGFNSWARAFPARYAVRSGEGLKDIGSFASHVGKVLELTREMSSRDLCLVVAGGGSVGDFGGFLASVLKRGVRLVHLPSTWLAALDSAHGGKTALNVGGLKNQIGTFYPASDIYLVKPMLIAQPNERAQDAFGELAKMALIDGGTWTRSLERSLDRGVDPNEIFWKYLRTGIEAKYKVVAKDPLERSGHRQILNFGHTLGHVLEASLGLAHGQAVAQGLFFALGWSFRRGDLNLEAYGRARSLLQERFGFTPLIQVKSYLKKRPSIERARALLLQDKKRSGRGEVTFVFLKAPGKPLRDRVRVEDLLKEAREQGWLK